MSNLTRLDELIREGEELVPEGGRDLVEGYNRQHQAAYASWRERCMVALNEIGPAANYLVHELASDTRGSYFYQSSASRVLGVIKAARLISPMRPE